MRGYTLRPSEIQSIEAALSKEDRVELIPTRDGVKIVRIHREPVKSKEESAS